MIETIAKDFIASFFAAAFFSMLSGVPNRNIPATSLLSGFAYVIFDLLDMLAGQLAAGYFFASMFIAIGSYIFARVLKAPSTVFIYPAMIPLVPGLGIYRTMYSLVTRDYDGFRTYGTDPIVAALSMAMALAVSALFSRLVFSRKKKKTE